MVSTGLRVQLDRLDQADKLEQPAQTAGTVKPVHLEWLEPPVQRVKPVVRATVAMLEPKALPELVVPTDQQARLVLLE